MSADDTEREYDVVIVGGGISGLYAAYKFKKKWPRKTFLVLERDAVVGGRMNRARFCDVEVNTGAGVGRKRKDAILTRLLDDLGVEHRDFEVSVEYSDGVTSNLGSAIRMLKRRYVAEDHSGMTFRRYASAVLGREAYARFVERMGFSDFESESAQDVLRNYGLEDNLGGWTAMAIDWALVIARLSERVGKRNIRTDEEVVRLDVMSPDRVLVHCKRGSYSAKRAILASTVDTVRRLLPRCGIYRDVHGQSFMRMYGKFGAPLPGGVVGTGTVVVPGPLKKISPVDVDRGIYQIAYTDNAGADFLNGYSRNTAKNRAALSRMVSTALGLDPTTDLELSAIKAFYWKIGTHYYAPLKGAHETREDFIRRAQRPYSNVSVVGEMVAMHQGWTRGALESVRNIIF